LRTLSRKKAKKYSGEIRIVAALWGFVPAARAPLIAMRTEFLLF
jgi:hypothetical protein